MKRVFETAECEEVILGIPYSSLTEWVYNYTQNLQHNTDHIPLLHFVVNNKSTAQTVSLKRAH